MSDYSRYEPSVTARVYVPSISNSEHRELRLAIDLASVVGDVTWIKNTAGAPVAAIVPVAVALGEDQAEDTD